MINLIKKKGINPQTGQAIYFPQFTRKETINGQKLATRMARGGSFSLGECTGVLLDFPQYFVDELLDGNAVRIDGLGTFKLKVSGKSRAKIEDVTSAGATVQVIYEPDPALDARLNSEKEFQFVQKPTADGEQDATDEGAGGSGGSQEGGDDDGGGENGGDTPTPPENGGENEE